MKRRRRDSQGANARAEPHQETVVKKIMTAAALAMSLLASGCTLFPAWGPSPYPHNPEYDVYVRGEYVGSDPDPRIRWSLLEEWKQSHNLR
jgi:hypothetical protein